MSLYSKFVSIERTFNAQKPEKHDETNKPKNHTSKPDHNAIPCSRLLVQDQLRLPSSAGDPRIAPNQVKKLNRNRYEIATSTCLFSVNISPWFDNLIGNSQSSQETRVSELVNVIDSGREFAKSATWTGARALRAISIQLARENENDELTMEEDEILHLVLLETNDGVFTVSTFENSAWTASGARPTTSTGTGPMAPVKSSIEQQLAELKPIPACVISDKISEEEALDAALKYIEVIENRMKKHAELARAAMERCTALAASAQVLDEKQQALDERLVAETTTVETLKVQMHELKSRMEATRKTMNVLFHRVEENVPLSDNEIRIYERLKEHQKMLSDMSIQVPKVSHFQMTSKSENPIIFSSLSTLTNSTASPTILPKSESEKSRTSSRRSRESNQSTFLITYH